MHEHAHPLAEDEPRVEDRARDQRVRRRRPSRGLHRADAHAAGAEVVQARALHRRVRRAPAQPQPVAARVTHADAVQLEPRGVARDDRGVRQEGGRLPVRHAALRARVLPVRHLEGHVVDRHAAQRWRPAAAAAAVVVVVVLLLVVVARLRLDGEQAREAGGRGEALGVVRVGHRARRVQHDRGVRERVAPAVALAVRAAHRKLAGRVDKALKALEHEAAARVLEVRLRERLPARPVPHERPPRAVVPRDAVARGRPRPEDDGVRALQRAAVALQALPRLVDEPPSRKRIGQRRRPPQEALVWMARGRHALRRRAAGADPQLPR